MLQLIHFFISQQWEVVVGSTAAKKNNSIDLGVFGVKEVPIELNNSSFDKLIREMKPTIVLFDRFMIEEQFGWRVSEYCPTAMKILDTEDLHCLRKAREEAIKKGIKFSNDLLLSSEIAKREIASIYRCDVSLIISTYEMKILEDFFKVDKKLLYHLPFFLPKINQSHPGWKSFKERNHFISIGNFLHAPNLDATIQLKKYIWKSIKSKIPSAEIHLYGAYPTPQVLQYNNPNDGFFVHGYVEDAIEVIGNSKVLLAPLRFGAGIKGKLTTAMQCGTPSVTTEIGAEGMSDNLPWSGFIENDIEYFVDKAVRLYTDEEVWNLAQERGISINNKFFDEDILGPNFLKRIQIQYNHLETNRSQNFTGNMLSHHFLKSTKYMSKWIEEKNSK